MDRSHYTFGDNSLAARRLNLLASTFDPSSRRLLEQVPQQALETALDVGCGPGHTTRLLADVGKARRTIGFDQSPSFLDLARANYGSDASLGFEYCNVLDGPLPVPMAQLVFSRFLLTHLSDPGLALRNLLERLMPGGHLVLEEIEHLDGNTPLLRRYYELVDTLQASHGQSMTIGARLEAVIAGSRAAAKIVTSEGNRLVLTGTQMPKLHLMNIATWKQDPKIAAVASSDELDSIERGLSELAAAGGAHVECSLRQVVLRKQ